MIRKFSRAALAATVLAATTAVIGLAVGSANAAPEGTPTLAPLGSAGTNIQTTNFTLSPSSGTFNWGSFKNLREHPKSSSVVMLATVAALVVPYLYSELRSEPHDL